ncbi:interleukin-8-like [Pristis pectinata]|uniref:interleukin-8-like n=1 Tax=Pristis pectinata TaxID=685728 RepID=UPI00223E4163|nr:interleukin-8-like [Pristis pectinata]
MNYCTTVTILLLLGHCAVFSKDAPLDEDENIRCRCVHTERRKIPSKLIKLIQIFPSCKRCKHTEIIVLSTSDHQICVQVTAPWVKKLLDDLLANSTVKAIS